MDSGELAPGFNFAIFDDFSKKHKGPPLFPKKSVEKSEKFFLEIIEERVSNLFLSSLARVPPFFSRGPPIMSPPLKVGYRVEVDCLLLLRGALQPLLLAQKIGLPKFLNRFLMKKLAF